MSYHKLMMENNTMYTKKVFDNVADRKLSKGQPKILEYLYEMMVQYRKILQSLVLLNKQLSQAF